jgi:hypothetical protein
MKHNRVGSKFAHRREVARISGVRGTDQGSGFQSRRPARGGHGHGEMQGGQLKGRQRNRCGRVGAARLVPDGRALGRLNPGSRRAGQSYDLDIFWSWRFRRRRPVAHVADSRPRRTSTGPP